ncbi:MAG TPA: ABC transporter permease subunit [Acidimicrobiia bacterium]|nr:ABC transporter permease subunit [Acidimicrobiia bacterium]
MTATSPPVSLTVGTDAVRRVLPWLGFVGVVAVLQLAVTGSFPAVLDTFFSDAFDDLGTWIRQNRRSHVLFTAFFMPLTSFLGWVIEGFESLLLWLPWYFLPALVLLALARVHMWKQGVAAALALLYAGGVGLWQPTMETLALMGTAVLFAVLIGVPVGVLAARRKRVEAAIRPVLDAMQTVPAFVYFLPLLGFFGVGAVNAAVATVIYALPPVVRLTTLGIRQVPRAAVEAGEMFGSTQRQTLLKVQLPMALPTILTGLSQTIMMALGIAVLAALIGAGGLGAAVLQTLSQRRTGRGIAAGLAIVAVAVVLDRMWRGLAQIDRTRRVSKRVTLVGGLALVVGLVVGVMAGWSRFPAVTTINAFDPIDQVVVWARDNLSWATRPFNDFIIAGVIIPVREFLTFTVAWPVLVFVTAWACWKVGGWGLAVFSALALWTMGAIGLWAISIDTLVQVMVGVLVSVAIAVPIGVWAGRRPRVEAALGPILDGLQTIPALVYIIPAVILFTVGAVPGIIASVLYAVVPGIRITALGIREVPEESVEASRTFGATPRQTMFGVRLPLAAPTIMAGVNQVIMMVLAMVIIAGLVGGGALGFETVRALTRNLYGLGFEVGLAIVLMAMILDRFTQAWAARLQPPAS